MYFPDRITVQEDRFHGRPFLEHARVTIDQVLARIAQGLSVPQILNDLMALTEEDIRICLHFFGERQRLLRYPN